MTCLISLACFLLSTLAVFADGSTFPPPGTPANFTATASGGSVALSWTPPSYAVSYNLYRALSPGAEGTTPYQAGLTSTGYTDAGVTGGTTYYYILRAVNADDVAGQPTAEVSAAPSTSTLPAPAFLAAAATGANKITLYWSGVSGASGYNVYRSMVSGGPYAQIGFNVAMADPGLGMSGNFMYSDTAGLATGTEYFYVVTAVQSGTEGPQSSEDSASPDTHAVPWDTGNAAQIVTQVTASVVTALEPDIDPDTGDQYPATAGILTACGPNGVLYQGNYADNSPATSYPPSAYYDSGSGTIIYGDGTAASAPAEGDANADAPAPAANPFAPSFQSSDLYNYQGNNTGIWRKILSQPGFWGASGTCGLPNLNDPNSVVLAVHSYPVNSTKTGNYSDSGDIYFGGTVNYTGPTPTDKNGNPAPYSNYELDLGLQASASLASTSVPGWVPVVNPTGDPNSAVGNTRSTAVSGVTLSIINGSIKGNKIYAVNETRMQFITPNFANIADKMVALHLAPPFGSVAGGKILVAPFVPLNGGLGLGTPVSYSAATLVYYAQGWRKSAMNKASGNNLFSIKRTNSIAQSLLDANHQYYPPANGPTESNVKSFLIDSSAIRGAYWGNNGDSRGVELNTNGSWVPWTDDSSQSLHSGGYPNSKIGGYGYVTWVKQNGFTWETNINLKANHTLP